MLFPLFLEITNYGLGKFFVRPYVQDGNGRFNRSEACLWVLGGDNMSSSPADCDSIIVIPDKMVSNRKKALVRTGKKLNDFGVST